MATRRRKAARKPTRESNYSGGRHLSPARTTKWLKRILALLAAVILSGCAAALQLNSLFQQLETRFLRKDESQPLRIYADAPRLGPNLSRREIEGILQDRSIPFMSRRNPDGYSIQFTRRMKTHPPFLFEEELTEETTEETTENTTEEGAQKAAPLPASESPAAFEENSDQVRESEVRLNFRSADPQTTFDEALVNDQKVQAVRLEPELIATLVAMPSDLPDSDSPPEDLPRERREIRTHVPFDQIPHSIKIAVMAAEDQYYLDHKGLDPRGIARAIWVNLKTLSFAQGGSTITQQLVKNLMVRRNKNLLRKVSEVFLAVGLELKYDKELILERYLNEVYLGQVGSLEVHGVVEGAQLFFGKPLQELSLAEMAMMAGFIRGPGYYSPYQYRARANERAQWVIKRMVDAGFISAAEARDARVKAIQFEPPQRASNRSPWFTEYVKAQLLKELGSRWTEEEILNKGLRVYTTLDPQLNVLAQKAVAEGVALHEQDLKLSPEQGRLEGALVAAEPETGYIKALVGGRNFSESSFNRILNMKRQVGSTFKPIVFLSALIQGTDEKGIPFGPAYPLEDSPWTFIYDRGRQRWTPKNFEKEYQGWISQRVALAKSINTATARLAVQVGIDTIIETARKLGIESDLPEVPSLSLGVAELSPLELLTVYSTLANHGQFDQLTGIRAITERDGTPIKRWVPAPTQRVAAAEADLMTDYLRSVFTLGSAKEAPRLGLKRPAAGKTGTTNHHRDAWFAGYTPRLATVTWVGFDQDDPNRGTEVELKRKKKGKGPEKKIIPIRLTGATSALPIWVRFIEAAHRNKPPTPFVGSSTLKEVRINRMSGAPATADCPEEFVMHELMLGSAVDGEASATPQCETDWPPSSPQSTEE
jgi:penicillin-binding protein 1B